MKITILALGSRGDVQPMVALGKGLKSVGYDVNIATHAMFESFVNEMGLNMSLVNTNPRESFENEDGQKAFEDSDAGLKSLYNIVKSFRPGIVKSGQECLEACQGSDVVLYSGIGFYIGPSIAQKLQIQEVSAFLQPYMHPTNTIPSSILARKDMGSLINRWSYSLSAPLIWNVFRSSVNKWRQEHMGLDPLGWGYMNDWRRTKVPSIYGISSNVMPQPDDWESHLKVTGYWFLNEPDDWKPTPELVSFLDAGAPPLYFGFGSMSIPNPEELTDTIVQAVNRTGQRAVLLGGWGGLGQGNLPDNILQIDSAPHNWLFPRMKAVIHHGGAGTTAAGLRAGVPGAVIPFLADQPFWGQRLHDLGVGVKPLFRGKLTIDQLAQSIQTMTQTDAIIERARTLGQQIRNEDGVSRAAEFVSQQLQSGAAYA